MSIDLNIDNYTIEDMEDFLELPEDYTADYVNILIDSVPVYDDEKSRFVEGMRERLLKSLGVTDIASSRNDTNLPIKYEHPYDNTTNPFVTNEISSLVCLNTRYILNDENSYKTHDYTVNLGEKLHRVTSLRISGVHLPTTWYTIPSDEHGTIYFEKIEPEFNMSWRAKCVIPKGVYKIDTLIDTINEKFSEVNVSQHVLEYDIFTDKVKVNGIRDFPSSFRQADLEDAKAIHYAYQSRDRSNDDGNTSFNVSAPLEQDIEDANDIIIRSKCTLNVTMYDDSWMFRKPYRSIGRMLGFRDNVTTLSTGESPKFDYDLDGTKHIMLVVDDFTRNSHSNGLISTDIVTTKLKVPEYVKDCECPTSTSERVLYASRKPGLTYHRLYTVNEIAVNRTETLPSLSPSPSDTLGIIPVYPGTTPFPITSSGGDISGGSRNYFGPVSISKFRIRLLDDGGEPLDIQNEDWVLTLSVSRLYQY